MVTPLAGVWIEIYCPRCKVEYIIVTPLAGVWIEISMEDRVPAEPEVTPLAGVWIEISDYIMSLRVLASLPLRECGLK